jgi:uncharacterized RDD family membrane protein YckC
MLDTLACVQTPEGVLLQLRAAGVMPRAMAWLVDFTIRLAMLFIFATVAGIAGAAGSGAFSIFLFAVWWLYPIAFEVLMDGQTIGKRTMQLRVVHDNGTPVGWLASIVRNLMRTVDMLPLFYGFGFAASMLDGRSRRLGDMVAGTIVVYTEKAEFVSTAPLVPLVLPTQVLSATERAAIVSFAERAALLTPERQQELANLLSGLSRAQGAVGVQQLLGMASHFLGRA